MRLLLGAGAKDFRSNGHHVEWWADLDGTKVLIAAAHDVLEDAGKRAGMKDIVLSQSQRSFIEEAANKALEKGREVEMQFERGTKICKAPILRLRAEDFD